MSGAGGIVALAGGVGAARFLSGLVSAVAPERVTVIGNTGDDVTLHGLHISPDLDTVTYTLAGSVDEDRGWGLKDDTFHCLGALERFGAPAWFRLGDRDLATHLFRTERLRQGAPLSEVTSEIAAAMGVRTRILPMSDQRVRTRLQTDHGVLDFQVYFVQRRAEDAVRSVMFDGAADARPAPGVLEAIERAAAIIICPSNPFISIGPILAVPGVRDALKAAPAPVAAISPIVGGQALKGPAARMMATLGMEVSARQVAELYADFLDVFVLDHVDAPLAASIEGAGIRTAVTGTVMKNAADRKALALAALEALSFKV